MSKVVKGLGLFALLFLFLVIYMTIHGRTVRTDENTTALTNAIETALTSTMEQRAYAIDDSDEFVADFLETLLAQYDNDSEITVKILKQDREKGLLSVEVDEKYSHPNGGTGTVSATRTVIFDKAVVADEVCHTINFLVDGEIYKTYSITKGEALIVPPNPQKENQVFDSWYSSELNDKAVIAGMVADQDYNFEARFRN